VRTLDQPAVCPSTKPSVRRSRAPLKVASPGQSMGVTWLRLSSRRGPSATTTTANARLTRNTARQLARSTSTPATTGPRARPAPNAVPRTPKARARALEGSGQDRRAAGQNAGRANALDRARDVHQQDLRAHGADKRHRRVDERPDEQGPPTTEPVGEAARGEQRCRECDVVRVEQPLDRRAAGGQVGSHRCQGHRGSGDRERNHHARQPDGGQGRRGHLSCSGRGADHLGGNCHGSLLSTSLPVRTLSGERAERGDRAGVCRCAHAPRTVAAGPLPSRYRHRADCP